VEKFVLEDSLESPVPNFLVPKNKEEALLLLLLLSLMVSRIAVSLIWQLRGTAVW
jgi:hypothetical protein